MFEFNPWILCFIFGAFLVLTAILGGGFEVKELKIPTVSAVVRVLSGASGLAFLFVGIALSPVIAPVVDPPEVVTGPSPEAEGPPANTGIDASTSFADTYSASTQSAQGEGYEYAVASDISGQLAALFPVQWTEINGEPYEDEYGNVILDVRASSDLQSFQETWTTPGIIVRASADVSEEGLGSFANRVTHYAQQCDAEEGLPYDDGLYAGIYDVYSNCGGTDTMYIAVTAMPEDESFVIGAEIQVVDDRDLEALDKLFSSFELIIDDGTAQT